MLRTWRGAREDFGAGKGIGMGRGDCRHGTRSMFSCADRRSFYDWCRSCGAAKQPKFSIGHRAVDQRLLGNFGKDAVS
jgi:hypothetical protein